MAVTPGTSVISWLITLNILPLLATDIACREDTAKLAPAERHLHIRWSSKTALGMRNRLYSSHIRVTSR